MAKKKTISPEDKIKRVKNIVHLPKARKKIYGCKPDLIDKRDIHYGDILTWG